MFVLSDPATLVGLVTFSAMIPGMFVAPFAGMLADRIDRRHLLAWAFGLNLAHNGPPRAMDPGHHGERLLGGCSPQFLEGTPPHVVYRWHTGRNLSSGGGLTYLSAH